MDAGRLCKAYEPVGKTLLERWDANGDAVLLEAFVNGNPCEPGPSLTLKVPLHAEQEEEKRCVKKHRQPRGASFIGSEPIEATNADRGLDTTLPSDPGTFDGYFEIDASVIANCQNAVVTVDVAAPEVVPVRLTGHDVVIAEAIFKDSVPWIVVSLVNPTTS